MNNARLFLLLFVVGVVLTAVAGLIVLSDGSTGLAGGLAGAGAGLMLSAVVYRLLPRWWREQADEEYDEPAMRRYRRNMLPAMGLYALLVFASMWLLRLPVESAPLRALFAVLPVLPMGWVMAAFLRYVREVDEFKHRIELEAIGVAALLVAMLYMTGGFLQLGGLIEVPSGVAMIWVFPLLALGYGLGKFLAQRKYR